MKLLTKLSKRHRKHSKAVIRSILLPVFPLVLFFSLTPGIQAGSYYRRGKIAFSTRNYTRAIENFQKAIKYNPNNGNAHFYLGYIHERLDDKDKAVLSYRRAVGLRMDRDLRKKAYWKIVLYYKYYKDWNNLAIYARRFLRYNNSKQVLKLVELAAANMDPILGRVTVLVARGERKLRARQYPEAIEFFQKALSLRRYHRAARWGLAASLIKQKQYAKAIPHLEFLTRRNIKLWQYPYKLGICYYQVGKSQAALRQFARTRKLYEEPSKSFDFYINIREGMALLDLGKYAPASRKLKAAMKIKPSTKALGGLALSEMGLGNKAEAGRLARKAVSRKKGQPEATLALALLALESGKKNKAFRLLTGLYKNNPEQTKALYPHDSSFYKLGGLQLGLLAARKGRWKLALRYLDAVEVSFLDTNTYPGSLPADVKNTYYLYYGQAHLNNQNPGRAINLLEKLGESPFPLYLIARAYAVTGKTLEARNYLQRAAQLRPIYWTNAGREPEFKKLSNNDEEFSRFIQYKGNPPVKQSEPEPKKAPEVKPEPKQAPEAKTRPTPKPEAPKK